MQSKEFIESCLIVAISISKSYLIAPLLAAGVSRFTNILVTLQQA